MDWIIKEQRERENYASVGSSFYKGLDGPVRMFHITSQNPQIKKNEVYDLRIEHYLPTLVKNLGEVFGVNEKKQKIHAEESIGSFGQNKKIEINATERKRLTQATLSLYPQLNVNNNRQSMSSNQFSNFMNSPNGRPRPSYY